MGVPLRVDVAHPSLLGAVSRLCTGWEEPLPSAIDPLRLRLSLADLPVASDDIDITADARRMSVSVDGFEGWADLATGTAECWIRDPGLFDDHRTAATLLEPLILFLLNGRDRTPVHASAFVAGDLAVLLAGRSGSGKSCLALAAHRAGYRLLSDDTVYVQLGPRLAVRGIPRPVHLFAEDSPDRDDAPLRLRNGKLKRAIDLVCPAGTPPPGRAVICLLARGDRVALDPIAREAALAQLMELEPGFDLFADDSARVFDRLTQHGAWRLTLGSRPDEAIEELAIHLPALRAAAA